MNNAFVGRQPILNRKLEIFAYELLFRSGDGVRGTMADGDRATASVLLSTLTDIGLDRVVSGKMAFVNITRNLLLGDEIQCLPPHRIVLELLEDICPDGEVLSAVRHMRECGFTIALDDYVYRPELDSLVGLADIVKVDLPQTPRERLAADVRRLRDREVMVLAEKVETPEDFELCKNAGCELFQGYFFCKPQTISHARVDNNPVAIVNLLRELQNPRANSHETERILRMDANLCYKILRFANSAQVSGVATIESIRHAVTLMGVARIRSIATMMLMAGLGSGKPQELLAIAMIRAKTSELLADRLGEHQTDRMFTAGILSVFDAMLDMPMHDVVQMLPLSEELNQALLGYSGIMGEILQCALDCERGELPTNGLRTLSPNDVANCYMTAVGWVMQCMEETRSESAKEVPVGA